MEPDSPSASSEEEIKTFQADINSYSDFPSLSGGPRPAQSNTAAASWNSSAIRQPSQPSQQPPTQQQRAPSAAPSQQSVDQFETQRAQAQSSERQQSGDDFPPLGGQGGQVNGDVLTQTPSGFTSSLGSPDMQHPRTTSQQTPAPMRDASASFAQAQQPPIGPPPPQSQQAPTQTTQTPPTSNVKRYGDMTEAEKWGIEGLMASFEARRVIESGGRADDTLPPEMVNGIMMGQDLDQLGMDLNSDVPLIHTFTPFPAVNMSGSSYDYHDRHVVPDFHLPGGYTVNNVPPLPGRMSAFSDGEFSSSSSQRNFTDAKSPETLFSVFYQHPRDIIQEFAAHELVGRDWRWHKIVRQWLQKDTKESNANSSLPLVDLTQGAPIGIPPIRISERSERGVYVFFDARNWRRERREFMLDYEQLENKVIPGMTPGMGLLGGPVGGGGGGSVMGGQGGLGQGGQGSSQVPGA